MNIHLDALGNSIRNILLQCNNDGPIEHNYKQLSNIFVTQIGYGYRMDESVYNYISDFFYDMCHQYDNFYQYTLGEAVDRIYTEIKRLESTNNNFVRNSYNIPEYRGENNAV